MEKENHSRIERSTGAFRKPPRLHTYVQAVKDRFGVDLLVDDRGIVYPKDLTPERIEDIKKFIRTYK